jgi:hypothetical protein
MSKLFRAAVLFAAIGAVMYASGIATVAPAQEKKGEATKTAKAADDDEVGTVEIYKSKEGWRYRVRNAEGKTIAIPTVDYPSPEEVTKILNQVKTTLSKAKVKTLKEKDKDK